MYVETYVYAAKRRDFISFVIALSTRYFYRSKPGLNRLDLMVLYSCVFDMIQTLSYYLLLNLVLLFLFLYYIFTIVIFFF